MASLEQKDNTNLSTLKAAFPDIDSTVISAVLVASSDNVNKAFDALLGMSDPDFKADVPTRQIEPNDGSTEQREQIEADERFARQLARESSTARHRQRRSNSAHSPEAERSFLDDDLPVIKENLIQGFNDTKLKVNSFINSLKTQYNQRLDNIETDKSRDPNNQGSRRENSRSSIQYEADPDAIAVSLDDDFDQLQLEDNTASGGNKTLNPADTKRTSTMKSKWQPMESIKSNKNDPSEDKETKKDTFALGDDDE